MDPDHLPQADPRVQGRRLSPGRLVRPLRARPDAPLPQSGQPPEAHHRPVDPHPERAHGLRRRAPALVGLLAQGDRQPRDGRRARPLLRDGPLRTSPPQGGESRDERTVDYSAEVSPDPRWSLQRTFPELSAHDAKALTYTTPPLTAAVEVTGYPVVHLWVSSSAPDADVFVYLEEVDAKGSSRYVTEGMLRASDRATADPGYDTAGLPYHRGTKADRADLTPGQPVELVFDLYPTSTLFAAGHRIRVTVTGADKANAVTPERNPPPKLTVYREAGRASYIELPVIPGG
ncbi:MAG: hypothetical protein DMF53_18430 [Acidobacteria bacterium]|nr:MAG: hypothetical protein DMF53_18430 [Acidobacteriota bacterium]